MYEIIFKFNGTTDCGLMPPPKGCDSLYQGVAIHPRLVNNAGSLRDYAISQASQNRSPICALEYARSGKAGTSADEVMMVNNFLEEAAKTLEFDPEKLKKVLGDSLKKLEMIV